ARTTRHAGYGVGKRFRKRVEEVFGWLKTVGLCRQTRFRGRKRVGWMFTFAVAAYNLVRLRNLRAVTGGGDSAGGMGGHRREAADGAFGQRVRPDLGTAEGVTRGQ